MHRRLSRPMTHDPALRPELCPCEEKARDPFSHIPPPLGLLILSHLRFLRAILPVKRWGSAVSFEAHLAQPQLTVAAPLHRHRNTATALACEQLPEEGRAQGFQR